MFIVDTFIVDFGVPKIIRIHDNIVICGFSLTLAHVFIMLSPCIHYLFMLS